VSPLLHAVAEFRGDQASGLRRLFSEESLRVVTFVAGGAGVGKTTVVANIAAALARRGKEVLVIDENPAGNVAAAFGVASRSDLFSVINRERRLDEVLLHVAPGVRVLPAARAVKRLGRLPAMQQEALIDALAGMAHPADVILVDASMDHPLGFSPLGLVAQETVVVTAASGAALTAAYALIKKVSLGYERRHFRILVSKTRHGLDAEALFRNLAQLSRERGVARLDYLGCVPQDETQKHALRLAQPLVAAYPDAAATHALRSLADEILAWPPAGSDCAGLEQFALQLLHFSQRIDPVTVHVG